jgi:hypothetical protein
VEKASAIHGSTSTTNPTHSHEPACIPGAGVYRRRIENLIRAGNTGLPRLEAWPTANQRVQPPVGLGFTAGLAAADVMVAHSQVIGLCQI